MTDRAPAIEDRVTYVDTATYVFAVCARLDPAVLTGLPGLAPDAPVRALALGPLTAVVQDVPAGHFTEEAWQERLSDPGELERCARSHHEVVSAAATCGPTVPLALATLYTSDERAREALGRDAGRFRTALRRIDGRVELGVKVYAPPPARTTAPEPTASLASAPTARSDATAPPTGPPPPPGAGRAYLESRRNAQRQRERLHDEALRTADTVDTALRDLAVEARQLRTHAEEMTVGRGAQVLNAAYLVAADRVEEVVDTVRTLRTVTGARIDVSGPWVPYSFAGEV